MNPWNEEGWAALSEQSLDSALETAGHHRTGPVTEVKRWGRSCVQRAPTSAGPIWIKHSYRLPPGEEVVLDRLAGRWTDRIPRLVACWEGAVAMEQLPGIELNETHPLSDWTAAARSLAEICAGEISQAADWLDLGVRDRRPPAFQRAVEALPASPALQALPSAIRERFEALLPRLVSRYAEAYDGLTTLVHQDSGCCNIHITPEGPVIFDWSDVVVGHPVFSCDRLLDQVPAEHQAAVIDAFLEPLDLSLQSFRALRRSNVLHEVLRYHDELSYLAPDDPIYDSLAQSTRAQIKVIVDHS